MVNNNRIAKVLTKTGVLSQKRIQCLTCLMNPEHIYQYHKLITMKSQVTKKGDFEKPVHTNIKKRL